MPVPNNFLAVEGLSLSFQTRVLFQDISLTLAKGRMAVITGESGTGKTSLLRCLFGFVQPVSGTIRLDGSELNDRTVWSLRRRMAFVQQEPSLGKGRVIDALRLPFFFKANQSAENPLARLNEMMEIFRLPLTLLEENVSRLSGGEKQRLALLSALTLQRELYLLDEVTSALDERSKNAVLDYLGRQKHLTILAVSHDCRMADMSDTVLHLERQEPGGAE
jgi:putative ABC transport system ATP-binding protein